MRSLSLALAAGLITAACPPVLAQTPAPGTKPPAAQAPVAQAPMSKAPAPAAPPVPASPPASAQAAAAPAEIAADPVMARVGPVEIHASEVAEAAQALPEQMRGMPPTMLYPMLLDQLIDRHAIVLAARKQGLDRDPLVQKQIARATDSVLQNALLSRAIAPTLTPEAIKAVYDKDYANKPGEQEVRAEHILVPTEEKAKEIIAQLKAGKDFAALARENSTDPSAKENAGDLGYFKRGDMLPEFSDAAFALKPGQFTETPVKTRFGWHVIKVLDHRTAAAPSLEEVQDQIRQKLIQAGVTKVLAEAKQGLAIQKFKQDGTPITGPEPVPGLPAAPPAANSPAVSPPAKP